MIPSDCPRRQTGGAAPRGERLFVSADGKLTVEIKVDEQSQITGAKERRARYRHTFAHQVVEPTKK